MKGAEWEATLVPSLFQGRSKHDLKPVLLLHLAHTHTTADAARTPAAGLRRVAAPSSRHTATRLMSPGCHLDALSQTHPLCPM